MSDDGFSAKDYAHTAQNFLIAEMLSEHGGNHSGKDLPTNRGGALAQRQHPPFRAPVGKGLGGKGGKGGKP